MTTRRSAITTGVLTALGVGVVSNGASAKNSKDPITDDFEQRLRKRYGKVETNVTVPIVRRNIKAIENGRLTEKEAYSTCNQDIISHPKTPKLTEDVLRSIDIRSNEDDTDESSQEAISTSNVSTSSTFSYSVNDGEKYRSFSGGGGVDQRLDVSAKRIGGFARVSLYGSAYSRTRLYRRSLSVSGSLAGNVRVSVPYFWKGCSVDGPTRISIFIRESSSPSSTFVKNVVEFPSCDAGGRSVTRNAQFFLRNGVNYDIGLEVENEVSGIGAYNYSDLWSPAVDGARRVEVTGNISITSLD